MASPGSAWAVGNTALRWDGRQWSEWHIQDFGRLNSVDILGKTDAWAAGR